MQGDTRRLIAGKFGKIEHRAGETLGIWLWSTWYITHDQWGFISACIWSVYFIAHHLEKKIYGRYGWRQMNNQKYEK